MQIQNEENKDKQIHRSWTKIRVGVRVKIWHWINDKVRVWFWFWFWVSQFTLDNLYHFEHVKNLVLIFLTLNKSKNLVVNFLTLGKLSIFLDGCLVWARQKMLFILLTLGKSKIKLTTKLPWEKLDVWVILGHYLVSLALRPMKVSTGSELYPNKRLFLFLFECLGIEFFNLHSHVTYRTCCAWGHSHSCLGRLRISLGVAIILDLCLSSHQFTMILKLYLIKTEKFCLWWRL